MMTARLHDIVVAPSPPPEASPSLAQLPGSVLIGKHRYRFTPDDAHAAFAYVAERTHAATSDGEPL